MEIFRFNKRALKDYSIACEYWETSRAWGHRAILFYKGSQLLEVKVRYYNRTWEVYRYQSCMYKLVNTYHDEQLNEFIYDYKLSNGFKNFKRGEKQEVIDDFESSEKAKLIKMMKEAIGFGHSGDFKRD